MNYKWHYDNLIKTRKLLNRKKYKGIYYEDHHIVMTSMGGSDDKENRVLLTAKEHYIAHYLLWRIYRNRQTVYAFFYMCLDGNSTNIRISSRVYEEIREECSKISSESFKNMWDDPEIREKLSLANSIKNKGRVHTEESRKNMSDAHKGIKQSQETINKRISKCIGRKRSEETKQILSKLRKGLKLSEEWKQKLSEAAYHRHISEETKIKMHKKQSNFQKKPRKQFKLISPNNEEYVFNGLKLVFEFAKTNNISITLLKDWKDKGKIIPKTEYTKNSRNWELITLKRITYN